MEYPLSVRYLFGVFGGPAGKEPNADWHSIKTYCIYTQGAQQHILGYFAFQLTLMGTWLGKFYLMILSRLA